MLSFFRVLVPFAFVFGFSQSLLFSQTVSPPQVSFPASSLVDFSATLLKPAGTLGFLEVGEDGRFRWKKDGSRARFWGINVSSTRLNLPDAQIEAVVKNFARAGLNLVRLEAVDNRNCLLGSPLSHSSRTLDPAYLERLDFWMDCLRRNGIYYYLDLLDFRTFKEGDGVLNADRLDRAARPYALFDPFLIQLQKEYARLFLTHRNRYSGLRPVDDPAFALVEICNEHGFFLYPEKLDTLVEPYKTNLRRLFNAFLRAKYGSRSSLGSAWGSVKETPVLGDREDPAQDTVELPALTPPVGPQDANVADTRRSPARVADGVKFLADVQRGYFLEMRDYLRFLGVKIPITAVVSSDIVPDLATVADTCDFLSENWYGEGPRTDPRTPELKFYSNRSSLRDDRRTGFAPFTASLRWNHKPVVIREWASSWPNRYRVSSLPEVLAYSSLQDFDAVLLFGYQTNRAPNGAEADALNDYAFQQDPTVWGFLALAGQAYLNRAISPAKSHLTLFYPPEMLYSRPLHLSELHRAAWSLGLDTVADKTFAQSGLVTPADSSKDLARLAELLKSVSPTALTTGVWRSDTGEITRFDREGRLLLAAPKFRSLAGELTPNKIYDLGGGVKFASSSPVAAVILVSLDGKPIPKSEHYVVKMATVAQNTGERLEKAAAGSVGGFVLLSAGKGPVVTLGGPSQTPTRLWLPGDDPKTPSLTVGQKNGTWELEIKNKLARFRSDTPGVTALWRGKRLLSR